MTLSLTQMLTLGRPPEDASLTVRRSRRPEEPPPSLTSDQLEIAQSFTRERQEEWEERLAFNKAKDLHKTAKDLVVASDLAQAVIFEGKEVELSLRQRHLRRRRCVSSSVYNGSSGNSGTSSSSSDSAVASSDESDLSSSSSSRKPSTTASAAASSFPDTGREARHQQGHDRTAKLAGKHAKTRKRQDEEQIIDKRAKQGRNEKACPAAALQDRNADDFLGNPDVVRPSEAWAVEVVVGDVPEGNGEGDPRA